MPKKAFESISIVKQGKVIDCALKEFSEYDYHEASINRIVKCAGIPRGSFYQYFENKEDLFLYLFETILDGELEQFLPQRKEGMFTDPVLFHQLVFAFNLKMLSDEQYSDLWGNFFSIMNYHLTSRYNEIIKKQWIYATNIIGDQEIEIGKRVKEKLGIYSLITMDLLARKSVEELSDGEIWQQHDKRIQVLGWKRAEQVF